MQRFRYSIIVVFALLLAACGSATTSGNGTTTSTSTSSTSTGTGSTASSCTTGSVGTPGMYGPSDLRRALHVDCLIAKGDTGKGQTIIDMVCFGNPNVQNDLDMYSQQYGLPQTTVQVLAPLGPNQITDQNFAQGWAGETSLDVEMYHAVAPDAKIIVMEAPVCAPEGIVGLPQSREELQYIIDHHLGNIIAISGGTSEVTLADPASRAELKLWDAVLQEAATQAHITILVSSGDNGATDYANLTATQLSTTPTTSFPTDSPWVTAVGGTTLDPAQGNMSFSQVAWDMSGGGLSNFYNEPSYQQSLPSSDQTLLKGRRGVPDVAALANPATGVNVVINGQPTPGYGGTSIAAPQWAGVIAIADQMAGHPLGFINPTLYKLGLSSHAARDFVDITSGNNTQVVNGTTVPGFAATPGWDAITGWGAPLGDGLIPDLISGS